MRLKYKKRNAKREEYNIRNGESIRYTKRLSTIYEIDKRSTERSQTESQIGKNRNEMKEHMASVGQCQLI